MQIFSIQLESFNKQWKKSKSKKQKSEMFYLKSKQTNKLFSQFILHEGQLFYGKYFICIDLYKTQNTKKKSFQILNFRKS